MENSEDGNSKYPQTDASLMISTHPTGYARVPPSKLKAFALQSGLTIESWIRPVGGTNGVDIFVHASSRSRYQLSLDAIGSLLFDGCKPRKWMMVQEFADFPATELTLEFLVCPFRGNSQSTLVSYVTGHSEVTCDFAVIEYAHDGLTVVINDQRLASGVHLDYAQWQRIAVTWNSQTGQIAIYKDDGPKVIVAEGRERSAIVPFGLPVFIGTLAPGARLAAGGCLVVGQAQTRPGDILGFAMQAAYVGGMGEVRLWRQVLDQTILNAVKGLWLSGNEPGLVGCWSFTGLGLSAGEYTNICASGNNGVLGGFAAHLGVKDIIGYRILGVNGRLACLSQAVIPAGKWCHLAMVAPEARPNSCEPQLFIDGQQVATRPVPSEYLPLPEVGQGGIGPCGESALDAVRLWHLPLTAATLQQNYRHRYPVETTGLLAFYDGTSLRDGYLKNRLGQDFDLRIEGSLKAMPSTSPNA